MLPKMLSRSVLVQPEPDQAFAFELDGKVDPSEVPEPRVSEVQFDFVPQKSGRGRGFKRGNDSVEFVPIPRRAKYNAPLPSHRNSHY